MTRFSYTTIFVRDMKRSVKFYRDALGLPLRYESADWSEFATGSCNLALKKAAEGSVPPVVTDQVPAGHCQVGFIVTDLDDFHAKLIDQEIKCLQEPKAVKQGARSAVYADPDGLPVAVTEVVASGATN